MRPVLATIIMFSSCQLQYFWLNPSRVHSVDPVVAIDQCLRSFCLHCSVGWFVTAICCLLGFVYLCVWLITSLVSCLLWWTAVIQISFYHLSLINKWQAQLLCSLQDKTDTTFPDWDWSLIHNRFVQHPSIQISILLLKDLNEDLSASSFLVLHIDQ